MIKFYEPVNGLFLENHKNVSTDAAEWYSSFFLWAYDRPEDKLIWILPKHASVFFSLKNKTKKNIVNECCVCSWFHF